MKFFLQGASFGMEWNAKTPLNWDWDNLALFSGKDGEISKSAPQAEWRVEGGGGIGNGSVYSSCGGAFSGSELGNGSSKSSISASVDSSSNAGVHKLSDSNFEAVEGFSKNPIKNKELARVEDARTSPVAVATVGTKEPLIGLKLGKRTYFEDFCAGNNNTKNSSASSSSSSVTPSTTLAKNSRVSHQRMQTFYCQVQGCNADLTTAKDYHRKHRVCESHSKCPKVIVAGQERRFCQQCSRFHDLSEFDQKKRSCRRRLSDHNARRRKPQPETISFNSSRLSSSFYDYGQQMSFMLNRAPFGHTRPGSSSGPCGFKLSQAKESWVKSPNLGGPDGQLHFPSTELSNTFSVLTHDLDRLLPFKGTTAEVLDQGLEAPVAASNLDGAATDLRRALSLLSTDSWGPADHPGSSTPAQLVNTNHASVPHPAMHTLNSTAEYWQDEQPAAQQATTLSFDLHSNGSQFQEFQLLKAPYETAFFFDSSQIH